MNKLVLSSHRRKMLRLNSRSSILAILSISEHLHCQVWQNAAHYPDSVLVAVIKLNVKRWTLLTLVVAILATQQKGRDHQSCKNGVRGSCTSEQRGRCVGGDNCDQMLAVMLRLAATAKKERRGGQMLGLSFPVSAHQPCLWLYISKCIVYTVYYMEVYQMLQYQSLVASWQASELDHSDRRDWQCSLVANVLAVSSPVTVVHQ